MRTGTRTALDFLAVMYEAGKPEKDVLANLYGRYDCGTHTMYVLVVSVIGWAILPSDNDNYVKLGQTDKLVDGTDRCGWNAAGLRLRRRERLGSVVPDRARQLPRRTVAGTSTPR